MPQSGTGLRVLLRSEPGAGGFPKLTYARGFTTRNPHDTVVCMHMDLVSEQSVRADDIGDAWSRAVAAVAAVESGLNKWMQSTYGIGMTEFRAAMLLSRTSKRELRINDLATRVGLNQSSCTRLVGRMEDKELAFRDTCPDDGRGVYAVITDFGLETVDRIREAYSSKARELLTAAEGPLPGGEDADIKRILTALIDSI